MKHRESQSHLKICTCRDCTHRRRFPGFNLVAWAKLLKINHHIDLNNQPPTNAEELISEANLSAAGPRLLVKRRAGQAQWTVEFPDTMNDWPSYRQRKQYGQTHAQNQEKENAKWQT
jgi:hypothetical protein